MDFFKQNIIPGEVIVQLVAFLIVFFTLKKLAWGPILGALQARRDKIKGDFDEIDRAKAEIEKLKADYTASLQKIEEEAREKMQAAIDEGQKVAKEIQEEARSAAQESFEKSKQSLDLEISKARVSLRKEIADLAIRVSEKVVREEMTDSKQIEKALATIEELERA